MYLAFYGLADKPFSITPDPRYLYLSARHAEALAHLVYGLEQSGGFIQLTGEVGTGKTTTVRAVLARASSNTEIALILNPRQTPLEFLLSICEELHLAVPPEAAGSGKALVDLLGRHLLDAHAAGRRVVVVVDEAQNLTPDVLEQVRLLTNIETESTKLLQILLIGQPELRVLLERTDLRQLAQRITGRYHLDPLSRGETLAYVRHRLRVAGASTALFTEGALRELFRRSRGVPRLINIIADRALLGGFSQDRHVVTTGLVRRAASEVAGERLLPHWLPPLLVAGGLGLLAGVGWLAWQGLAPTPVVQQPAAVPAPPPAGSAAPETAELSLPQVLRQQAASTGLDSAWSVLFERWKLRYAVGEVDACTQASAQGLACRADRSTLDLLLRLDRPALLELPLGDSLHHVVLTGHTPERILLQVGTQELSVPRLQVESLWSGEYLLLWRPASPGGAQLALGDRGEPVRLLRSQLQRWRVGTSLAEGSADVFDAPLQEELRRFQAAQGLEADGVAGARTQLALDALLGERSAGPRLQRDGAR